MFKLTLFIYLCLVLCLVFSLQYYLLYYYILHFIYYFLYFYLLRSRFDPLFIICSNNCYHKLVCYTKGGYKANSASDRRTYVQNSCSIYYKFNLWQSFSSKIWSKQPITIVGFVITIIDKKFTNLTRKSIKKILFNAWKELLLVWNMNTFKSALGVYWNAFWIAFVVIKTTLRVVFQEL